MKIWALLLLAAAAVCAESDVLYVTMHGIHHLHAYDISTGAPVYKIEATQEMRGMVAVGNTLYVAQSPANDSAILQFDLCSSKPPVQAPLPTDNLSHPYGLAVSPDNTVLCVTNQDSNKLVTFNLTTMQEIPNAFPPIEGMRGINVDGAGRVWVNSQGDNALLLFDGLGANLVHRYPIQDPTGVLTVNNMVLVTSRDVVPVESLFNIDPYTWIWNSSEPVGHGAGMAYQMPLGILVAVQDTSEVLVVSAYDGTVERTLLTLPDVPEQLFLTQCP